ncbi:DUF551 domain-containing protein [Sphingomonas sp.]|uniref:DUF551 domain-containing protein n=1 Tax=Sphingomonas sp. TaxID=28214 RepID=UPI003FA6D02E
MPIESAPKDGTDILAWCTQFNGTPVIVRWDDDKYAKNPIPRWGTRDRVFGARDFLTKPPTHWMPLPAAPSAA